MVSDSPDEGLDDLLEALTGMADYGSVTVRGNGQITVPKPARKALNLRDSSQWRVFGLPHLGVAILIGEPDTPQEVFASLIRGRPRTSQEQTALHEPSEPGDPA
jgi:hypothetical protein